MDQEALARAVGKLSPVEREALLKVCSAPNARVQLERAFSATHQAIEVTQSLHQSVPEPSTPRTIGNYEVVAKLGEGGMGIVYDAKQLRPIVRRVALKVMRSRQWLGSQLSIRHWPC